LDKFFEGLRFSIPRRSRSRRPEPPSNFEALLIELLREWNYIDSPLMRLTDYGAFGNGDDNWAANLSGVLVTHNGGSIVQWLPNPFANEKIAKPQLLRIGLSLRQLGESIPSSMGR